MSGAWQGELAIRVETAEIIPPRNTVYFSLAEELLAMSVSYRADGSYFITTGDTVNALAAFSYALGWLDASSCLGLVRFRESSRRWLFSRETTREDESARLEEKTERYGQILGSALRNVVAAPQGETGIAGACERILCACFILAQFGDLFRSSGMRENALGSYSYAHAWLDAGVRAGLFRVLGKQELFAV